MSAEVGYCAMRISAYRTACFFFHLFEVPEIKTSFIFMPLHSNGVRGTAVTRHAVLSSVLHKNADMLQLSALQQTVHQRCGVNGAHRKQWFSICTCCDWHISSAKNASHCP